jgi:CRP/FNR family cyclic AMP-dependent transcriptional regulator
MLTDDQRATLLANGWFGALPPEHAAILASAAQVRAMPDGARAYCLGDPPDGLYAVLAGEVRLIGYPSDGLEMVAKIVRPGEWFGELSVIDGQARPHDAVAATGTVVAKVTMAAITRITTADPAFWRDLALLSCRHQRASLRDTGRIRSRAALPRLAGFLAASVAGQPDGIVGRTQEELSNIVGASRQHVNGLLARLRRLGLIESRYGGIAVLDVPGLKRLAQVARAGGDASGSRAKPLLPER